MSGRSWQNSPAGLVIVRFLRHGSGPWGAALLLLIATAVAAAPLIEAALGLDANAVDLYNRFQAPSWQHPLGTDALGRDVLVRLLYGGQISLIVGLVTALATAGLGILVGLPAGFFGGRIDAVLMRFTDAVIALPILPLLIVLSAIDLTELGIPQSLAHAQSTAIGKIVVVTALLGWPTAARLVRASCLAARGQVYVQAAVAMGAGPGRIMMRHILPNAAPPLLVATTIAVGNIILLESVLSFLGLGVQPPLSSWGNMLNHATELMWRAPLQAIYPGLTIFLTVLAVNLVGDGVQDALDPRRQTTL